MEATIHLKAGELPFVKANLGQIQREFQIDFDDLVEFLKESCYKEVKEVVIKPVIISEALPYGTVKYGERSDGSVVLSILYPEFQHDITFYGEEFPAIPFPTLLFTFDLSPKDKQGLRKRIRQKCFVVKDKIVREYTILYHFPYSNVYENGDICYFNHEEIIPELVTLQSFVWNWVSGDFNTHGYTRNRTTLNMELRQLLSHLSGKPFPYDILKPTGKQFQSIIEQYYEKEGRY